MELLLKQGLNQLKIEANQDQCDKLLLLVDQLIKWNKAYNLTAITDPKQCLIFHLLDSLAVLPYVNQKTVIDVGCGAGFPGLPLAIMLPQTSFSLLDSNGKKIRFIRQQIHTLNLSNVEVIHARVEEVIDQQYGAVISRAFSSVGEMVKLTSKLLGDKGRWLAMKGQHTRAEQEIAESQVEEIACHPLIIPGLDAQRCLLELKPLPKAKPAGAQTID